MVKECIKKGSNSGHNLHKARSCVIGINNNNNNEKEKCVKLFGFKIRVPVEDESATSALEMRKCKSAPDLIACGTNHGNFDEGYKSDGPPVATKKRGVPWTEKEHLAFLSGLEKLGKGNWKGISRKYVPSRNATQVASHAQKYFNRVNLTDKRNRRSSLFDMSLNGPEIKISTPPEPPNNTIQQLQADILPIRNVNENVDAEQQANNVSETAATPLMAPRVLPYTSCYGVPNFSQMPYIPMVGMPGNGQMFPATKSFDPAMPSVPIMYIPNPAYFYLSKAPLPLASNPLPMPTLAQSPSSMAIP